MNPPPYQPPQEGKNSLVRQILLASLIALPVIAFIGCVVVGAIHAHRKAAQARATWREMAASANQMQSDLKKNFDPKKGITNADFTGSDEFRARLEDASHKLSGDDAVFARVGAEHLQRMQTAAKNYHAAVEKLRENHVLGKFDSSDKEQIAARREIVQQFMNANTALKETIMGSEAKVRADLVAANIRESKIEAYMKGFRSGSTTRNALLIEIRQCDDRIGKATLDVLDTLEAHWGRWEADPAIDKIRFKDNGDLATYNTDLTIIKAAGQEQLNLQSQLVNQPVAQPPN